ncbi:hypothetical protein LCGC14_1180380, partial [marine sediment metagenome]
MPVENERKYVLLCDSAVVDEIVNAATYSDSIVQSYIQVGEGWSLRTREIRPYYQDNCQDDRMFDPKYVDYILTYKHMIDGELIEIETDILSEDCQKLNRRALSKLNKIRYRILHGSDTWEVDLFYRKFSDRIPYFILAEIELPAGQAAPTSIPSIISKHLLYEV